MPLLYNETLTGVDISVATEVLRRRFAGTFASIDVRLAVRGIVGGGYYAARVYINDSLVLPDRPVQVSSGVTDVILQSRNLAIYTDDTIAVTVAGVAGDVAVDVDINVQDVTPATAEDVSTAMADAVTQLNISVRPERVVLGPCARQTVQMPQPAPRQSRTGYLESAPRQLRTGYLMPVQRP